jgi:hypothetical protein
LNYLSITIIIMAVVKLVIVSDGILVKITPSQSDIYRYICMRQLLYITTTGVSFGVFIMVAYNNDPRGLALLMDQTELEIQPDTSHLKLTIGI